MIVTEVLKGVASLFVVGLCVGAGAHVGARVAEKGCDAGEKVAEKARKGVRLATQKAQVKIAERLVGSELPTGVALQRVKKAAHQVTT